MSEISQPGGKALEAMKAYTDINIFKKPFSKTKRKRKVLEEDEYLEDLGKIVERDFFPHMRKLRAQNEYLDALSENDPEKLRLVYSKYSSGKRPPTERVASPATFETPAPQSSRDEDADPSKELKSTSEQGSKTENECKKLTLDEYVNSHTSEDNESFEEIQEETERKHRLKYAWQYKDEDAVNSVINEQLKLPSIEQQAAGFERPLALDSWTYRNQNHIMFIPNGVEPSREQKLEAVTKQRVIVHENTSLAINPFNERQNKQTIHELASTQARNQEGKIGVDGKIVMNNKTPVINGFSLVRTPSPQPGVCESPLMTWGEIEGTPFRLDGGDTPYAHSAGPTFRIPETPKRERLAMALADKAGEVYRDRKRKAIELARSHLAAASPRRPGSSSHLLSQMSPAAQRLASASITRRGTDNALRDSYSPRRTPSRVSTPSPFPSPASSPLVRTTARRPTPLNITDDLLKLPRTSYNRPKASDFF